MNAEHRDSRREELIARLIQKAGRGPTASEEARRRIYAEVRAEWLRSVESETATRPVWRFRRLLTDLANSLSGGLPVWAVRGFAAVAALAVTAVLALLLAGPDPVPRIPIATVVKSVGPAGVRNEDDESYRRLEGLAETIYAGEIVVTGRAGGASVSLDNGIDLRIDAGSEIELRSDGLLVLRAGTVYLDTGAAAGDTGRALLVSTAFGTVEHLGTQYEVRIDDRNLRIRVREGAVAFRDSVREFIGEAGEQILIDDRDGEPLRTMIPTTGIEWEWVEGLATVPLADQYRLDELLSWIARETGRALLFDSEQIEEEAASTVLHGVEGLTPAESISVIESATELRYRLTERELIVF